MPRLLRLIAIAPVILLFVASCTSPKKVIYFREGVKNEDTTVSVQEMIPIPEIRIQPDDILSINVTSISSINEQNPDPVSIFNEGGTRYPLVPMAGGMGSGGGGGVQTNGFLVDQDGHIDFPVVGKIKLSGLTIRESKELLGNRLKDYVKDPVVETRIINYRVTILGEVGRPGPVIAPNHKLNVIEAVAAAGEIPITGRKDNVLVIRQKGDQREFARLNLHSKDVFRDPYFNLMQNDIVYVEPSRIRRQESNEFLRFYLPAIASLLTAALGVYGIVQLTK